MANGNEKSMGTGIDHDLGDKLLQRTVQSDPAVVSGRRNANFTIPNVITSTRERMEWEASVHLLRQ